MVLHVLTFGSTGLTGGHILSTLLSNGHKVTAFVRSRTRIDSKLVSSAHLNVVEGDILAKADVERAFATAAARGNIDAVVSSLSEGADIKLHVQSKGARLILDAIAGLKGTKPRLVLIGGAGILDSPQQKSGEPTTLWKTNPHFPAMFQQVAEEHVLIVGYLTNTRDVDWTIICPPSITDEPGDGKFVAAKSTFPSSKFQVKAGNIAQFILNELSERKFIGQRVGITDA